MNSNMKNEGIGCFTVVGIVFLILKLLAIEPVAHWSWLWVLCPFWLPAAIVLFISGVIFFITFLTIFKK